jgi:superfamily II DNA/RNA helicase
MLLPKVITDTLEVDLGVTVPSPVQQTAIPPALRREHCVIAAPSGTGKTLAYLSPVFANMLEDRDGHRIPTRERRPRCLILCSTYETVQQVAGVCKQFEERTGLHTVSFAGIPRRAKAARSRALKNHVADVVVASPHVLLRLIEARRLSLEDLRHIVIDDADATLGDPEANHAATLLAMMERRGRYKHLWPCDPQRIIVTSTVTEHLRRRFDKLPLGSLNILMPGLHEANSAKVRHRFYKASTNVDRTAHLQYLLTRGGNHPVPWPSQEPDECDFVHNWARIPVVDSTNRHAAEATPAQQRTQEDQVGREDSSSSDALAHTPRYQPRGDVTGSAVVLSPHHNPAGLPDDKLLVPAKCVWQNLIAVSAPFTGHIKRQIVLPGQRVVVYFNRIDRAVALYHKLHGEGFRIALVHGTLPVDVRKRHFQRWATGQANILFTTDLLARGIDYHVDHVINFDCPSSQMNYLVRSGRVGRMERSGRVSTLYHHVRDRPVVDVLRTFVRGDVALNRVTNKTWQVTLPTYYQHKAQKKDAIARRYIKLITTRRIAPDKEKTYLRTQATWRPLTHVPSIAANAGLNERKQHKVMDTTMQVAIWRRRAVEAQRKGGAAKFGKAGGRPQQQQRSAMSHQAGYHDAPTSPLASSPFGR